MVHTRVAYRRRWAYALALIATFVLGGVQYAAALGGAGQSAVPANSVREKKSDIDKQIAQVRESLEGASADFVEAAVALRKVQGQLAGAQQRLAAANQQVAQANARDQQLAGQLVFAQAERAKAERELAAKAAELIKTQGEIGKIAKQAYTGGGLSGVSVLLDAQTPAQLTDRLAYAETVMNVQHQTLNQVTIQQAEQRQRAEKLAALQTHIATLKQESAKVVAQRRVAQQAAATATNQIATKVREQRQAVGVINSKVAAEKKRLAALEAEQNKLRAMLRSRAGKNRTRHGSSAAVRVQPNESGRYLSYPVSGPISSEYGPRYHPILHYSRMHTGMDFSVGCGVPVRAAAAGEVVSAGWAGGYGNRVVIDHGNVAGTDLATTYNHLSRIAAHGGSVQRGELIGYVGTTGLSTGCHLHFETLAGGDYANPRRWL